MKLLIPIPIIALLTTLSGCAKDYTLAPPANSEKVTVTIKVPKELEAETMKVMYRSTLCTFNSRTASGVRYKRDGYQKTDIQPIRRGQTDLYDAKLPVDGGGVCQWRLSNVTFGVAYENPSQFGEGVTYGAGGGVVVAFDHNSPSRSGSRIQVNGDLSIIKDYYPWVDEEFLGQYRKSVSLLGEGNIYLGYKAVQARSVYYEVVLYSGFVLYSAGPRKKQKGDYTVYKFPDGSVVEDGRPDSTFLRMQAIRMAAEAKQ